MVTKAKTLAKRVNLIVEQQKTIKELQEALQRQDDAVSDAIRQLDDLHEVRAEAELNRKLVNHLLAAVNILAKGKQ